jgi:23S rRNA (adenine2503-C2)-methyltransferase
MKTLISVVDRSRNWLIPYGKSILECRYVRRENAKDKISLYVSSHNGCTMGCKFCWLTNQNQTTFKHSDLDSYMLQINTVLSHYQEQVRLNPGEKASRLNVNFMARGESLANKIVINDYPTFYDRVAEATKENNLDSFRMNISTIMPNVIKDRSLVDIFRDKPAYLYYSLYSNQQKFRDHWMPNAMDYKKALAKLKEYQEHSGIPITFHWAIIKGHNDDIVHVQQLANELKEYQFDAKFSIVRYNPHENSQSEEADDEARNEILKTLTPITKSSKIIPRVGYDVHASCGMFIDDKMV